MPRGRPRLTAPQTKLLGLIAAAPGRRTTVENLATASAFSIQVVGRVVHALDTAGMVEREGPEVWHDVWPSSRGTLYISRHITKK